MVRLESLAALRNVLRRPKNKEKAVGVKISLSKKQVKRV